MKKILTLLAILSVFSWGKAADEQIVPSEVDRVTVYLSGAQIFRKAKFTLVPGTQKVVLDSVSQFLQDQSLQATSSGSYTILDVKHDVRHIQPPVKEATIVPAHILTALDSLKDALDLLNFKLGQVQATIINLNGEKRLITGNKIMKGEGKGDSLPVLVEAVSFYRKQLEDIENKLYAEKLAEYKFLKKKQKLTARQTELNAYQKNLRPGAAPTVRTVHQVIVTIHSRIHQKTNITINYLVNCAGWHPSYDLRAKGTDKPMTITYKADVFQQTGFDWDGVELTLSTHAPTAQTAKPELPQWIVDYYTHVTKSLSYDVRNAQSNMRATLSNATKETKNRDKAPKVQGYKKLLEYDQSVKEVLSEVHRSIIHSEYKIQYDYTIESDGEPKVLLIREKDIPADYLHYVIPKVNKDVYVIARIPEWESLELLPASANIYFDNAYIGRTDIDPISMQDTMEIAMGIDRSVVVTRKKVKDEVETSILSKWASREMAIQLSLKNNKQVPITLEILDQIPVSKHEEIKVEIGTKGDGKLDEIKGTLTWLIELDATEHKLIDFTYTLEYDKNKEIL